MKKLGRIKLVGLGAPCSPGETIHIAAQWQRFMSTFHGAIPHKMKQMPIGLCEPPDEEGCFNYVCAAEVDSFGHRPAGLTPFECEPMTYAVFAHDDHVSKIFDTYTAIWNEALSALARTAANSPVLEFHNDAFDPGTGLGGLRLCIPLLD